MSYKLNVMYLRCIQVSQMVTQKGRGRRGRKTQENVPIPIIVVLLEHVCHALQADTTLHEQIEGYRVFSCREHVNTICVSRVIPYRKQDGQLLGAF
jgi:hypothetical protein